MTIDPEEWPVSEYDGYTIMCYGKGFDLDIDYHDNYYGNSSLSLDALQVYRNLKEYFKGTGYE